MQITKTAERISDDELLITGRVTVGFGLSADYAPRRDYVRIIPTEEFERLLTEQKPSGYHSIGCNRGAPLDGLELSVGGTSGIRYLVDATGAGVHYVYADAATVPSEPVVVAENAQ
jgi:hypothetical protein